MLGGGGRRCVCVCRGGGGGSDNHAHIVSEGNRYITFIKCKGGDKQGLLSRHWRDGRRDLRRCFRQTWVYYLHGA